MSENPAFFGVIEHIEIKGLDRAPDFSYIRTLGKDGSLYLVGFTVQDLEHPSTEPLALFFRYGTRRYLWRDRFWAEYELPKGPLLVGLTYLLKETKDEVETAEIRRLIDLVQRYHVCAGPTLEDTTGSDRKFYRVLYEINER